MASITIPDCVTYIAYAAFNNTAYYNNESNWKDGALYLDNWLIKADSEVVSGDYTIKSGTVGIANHAFYDCTDLTGIYFECDEPRIGSNAFYDVTATAYYPEGNDTWTEDVMQDYGGTITWVSYTTSVFDIVGIETTDSTDNSDVTDDNDVTDNEVELNADNDNDDDSDNTGEASSGCGSTFSTLSMIIVSTAAVLVILKKRKIKGRLHHT